MSTRLTLSRRRHLTILDSDWRDVDSRSQLLKTRMIEMLEDWGAFLQCELFVEGLTHFLGGEEKVLRRIPVYSGPRLIGEQDVHVASPEVAFVVTAVRDPVQPMRSHLELAHTRLQHLQWINLDQARIAFVTLNK